MKKINKKAVVVNVKVEKENINNLQNLIESWSHKRGHQIGGCEQIIFLEETRGKDRYSIIVLFADEKALDTFINDSDGLDIFDEAKPYFYGLVQHYTAKGHIVNL